MQMRAKKIMFSKNKYNTKFIVIACVIVVLILILFCLDFQNIQEIIETINQLTNNQNPSQNTASEMSGMRRKIIFFIFNFFGKIILASFVISFLLHIKKNAQIKKLKNKLSLWSKLSFHVSQIGEEVLNELPIGIVLIDISSQEIQWLNPYASFILKNPEINSPLAQINENMAQLISTSDAIPKTIITLENQKFECFYKKDLSVFYLFDANEKEQIKHLFLQKTLALAMIAFDNLAESLIRYDLSEQSQIQGEYLSALSDYIEPYEGYLKQLIDDRFLLLLNRQNLDKMLENKFSILDTIRNISYKYQLKVTLSMGIACWNLSYEKLATYSQNAIELAQKRGGDQVVVNIENEKIKYFGAKIASLSKQSKVHARINAQNLVDILKKHPHCFIMGHTHTDLDALGSVIAFYKIATTIHSESNNYIILDEEKLDKSLIPVYHQLIKTEAKTSLNIITTQQASKMIKDNSLIAVLDTQTKDMVNSPELLSLTSNIVVVDHHRATEEIIPSIFSYVESSASSTVELLVEVMGFLEKEVHITAFEASIMYAGILIDTNAFIYRTSSRTFEVASKLKDLGADAIEVKSWLRKDFDKVLEINKLISEMEIFMDRFAIIQSSEIYENRSFLAQVAESVLNIRNVDAAFMIAQIADNKIAISARSYNEINVQTIMEQMQGGGHLNSAATQLEGTNIKTVTDTLKHFLKLEYEKGEKNMEIILLTDIPNKGKKHEIIKVNNGYGNFLIQNKKALLADKTNLAAIKQSQMLEQEQKRNHELLMHKLKQEIDDKKITLDIQLGPKGKIYGKITLKQISEEFLKVHNITLDRKKISLEGEIIAIGIYPVDVFLTDQIKATFFLNVTERKSK
ncbi:50S ribosomal protein L9 ['Chrysanthemum coronarium' phytoplasma]|uniref:Large ribosomal subunit protein bL9 n=1 Tax='Chrysanthemum coronarium' phytoplasma TaxID=1520703 RepID=A0ABQ0J1U8_9MOLU|nr:50S ribosomal protein L9 ['Chrysanthemum coronarium' phytoplasma]GAK73596.1 exopolyphosphatase-related protein ['Chrysanthemum coronarium' phytoplasma]